MTSIRPINKKDIPALVIIASDPAITQLGVFARSMEEGQDLESIFTDMITLHSMGVFQSYAVLHKNEIVGCVHNYSAREAPDMHNLGCWLGQAHRGQGIAGAALNLLIDQIRKDDGGHDFQSTFMAAVALGNASSLRLMEKIGFLKCQDNPFFPPSSVPMQHFVLGT